LVSFSTKDSIILDFFSGSATTAHAVMQLNAEDDGNRKFIMVQLPELCPEDSEAYKAGFKNICEIGKERIRRAGDKIVSETGKNIDIGFKVFKLDSSNLIKWDSTPTTDTQELIQRIKDSLVYLVEGRTDEDLIYEIMLKSGNMLTDKVTELQYGSITAYKVEGIFNSLICLQSNINYNDVELMVKDDIDVFIFADRCFSDANALINTEEIIKKHEKKMELF
jgi:adenine-specific DNA-methyltransferase